VAFDVVETLMSLEPLRRRFVEIGLSASTLEGWFALVLRDGMALTLARDYEPFPAVAASALRVVGDDALSERDVRYVLAGLGELPAQLDAEPAMQVLSDAGITVVCLSNGAQDTTEAFLGRSGLDGYVDQVISVADVGQWKPPPQVYQYALHRVGRPAREVALVAVHAFDCHGAHAAGLTTGWAARHERYYGDVYTPPDVAGADLVEVAEALVCLPENRDTDGT
jgi:2-haloacid dehalogenase